MTLSVQLFWDHFSHRYLQIIVGIIGHLCTQFWPCGVNTLKDRTFCLESYEGVDIPLLKHLAPANSL